MHIKFFTSVIFAAVIAFFARAQIGSCKAQTAFEGAVSPILVQEASNSDKTEEPLDYMAESWSSPVIKEDAMKFMEWATSKSYVELVAETNGWGKVPTGTRQSTYDNANFQAADREMKKAGYY